LYGGNPMKNAESGEAIKTLTKEFSTGPNENGTTNMKHLRSTEQTLIFSIEGNVYFLATIPTSKFNQCKVQNYTLILRQKTLSAYIYPFNYVHIDKHNAHRYIFD
jgi:hypothetical protein